MDTSLHVAFLITEPLWLMTAHRYRSRVLPKPHVTHGYSHTGLQILYISIQIDLFCVRTQVVIWTTHLSSCSLYIHSHVGCTSDPQPSVIGTMFLPTPKFAHLSKASAFMKYKTRAREPINYGVYETDWPQKYIVSFGRWPCACISNTWEIGFSRANHMRDRREVKQIHITFSRVQAWPLPK